uniref:Uncharacterized protein n=1 Tax=Amphimedon queenslandica TaxID=400682 RepID=A0A1X7VNI2_AMPQE
MRADVTQSTLQCDTVPVSQQTTRYQALLYELLVLSLNGLRWGEHGGQ